MSPFPINHQDKELLMYVILVTFLQCTIGTEDRVCHQEA